MTAGRPASLALRAQGAGGGASPEVCRLVVAAIAGERYRSDARPTIERDLRAADHAELARALSAGHVATLFLRAFGPLVPEGALRVTLQAALRCGRLYAFEILARLAEVRRALGPLHSPPLILKGAGLWGWLYPEPALRRTRDLDLLIPGADDLRRSVRALRGLGFTGDDEALEAALGTIRHYELPPLTRHATVRVDAEDDRALTLLRTLYPELADLHRTGEGEYEMRVEVELHRALFLYRDGTLPVLPAEAIVPHALAEGYARLSLPAQLVYLAAKFAMDTEGAGGAPPQAQSLKLLADVVRLVERATPRELAESVELAGLWRCERLFSATVATAAPLLPEVGFSGLAHAPYDLDALVSLALTFPGGSELPAPPRNPPPPAACPPCAQGRDAR